VRIKFEDTEERKGFAFVTFDAEEHQTAAVTENATIQLKGRESVVQPTSPARPGGFRPQFRRLGRVRARIPRYEPAAARPPPPRVSVVDAAVRLMEEEEDRPSSFLAQTMHPIAEHQLLTNGVYTKGLRHKPVNQEHRNSSSLFTSCFRPFGRPDCSAVFGSGKVRYQFDRKRPQLRLCAGDIEWQHGPRPDGSCVES
jgi:RNA recognition motif-containing protein